MSKISFLLLFVIAFSTSCRSRKESNNQIESNYIYLSVSKTGCFGNFPIYTHAINGKNWSLIGERFFKYIGDFNVELSKSEVDEIMTLTELLKWDTFKSRYLSGYSDLPTTVVKYSSDIGDTTILTYENRLGPESLIKLVDFLDQKIDTKEWTVNGL
jgi:hypothetical protein